MHMLNVTLHGELSTRRLLETEGEDGEHHILRPIGPWLLDHTCYLNDLVIALRSMQLALQMFCLERPETDELKMTSHFAIMPVSGCR